MIFGFENYSDLCFITFTVDSVETASDISLAKHLRMPTVSNLCEFFTSHKRIAPFISFSNQVCSLSVVGVEALVLDFPHVLFILQNIWLNISKRNIFFIQLMDHYLFQGQYIMYEKSRIFRHLFLKQMS